MLQLFIAAALVFVNASDGDTLVMRDGNVKTVLRLAEIDSPERTQPYSQVSRRNLIELCIDAAIDFTPVTIDRYGRTVAHVRCGGIDASWHQVGSGLAWCFTRYLVDRDTCLPLEKQARDARRGLWSDADPLAPWDFRARNRIKEVTP